MTCIYKPQLEEIRMNNRRDAIYDSITFKKLIGIFGIGAGLGILYFLIIYGIKPLNVCDDSWLKSGGDLSQHYFGWCFYRNSEWHRYIGMIDGLMYPDQVCITYTDSIPLLAIFFKILSPILPETFQYFGLWGLFCFIMQGGLGAVLIRKATEKWYLCGIGAVFYITTVNMLQRMFRHTSLGGQWLILAAIVIWVYKPFFCTWKRQLTAWAALLFIAAYVHLYFVPMIAVMMFGFYLEDLLSYRKAVVSRYDLKQKNSQNQQSNQKQEGCQRQKGDHTGAGDQGQEETQQHQRFRGRAGRLVRNGFLYIEACVPALIGLKVLGSLEGTSGMSDEGLGTYSANLNVLWNNQGSTVGKILPVFKTFDGQYEGLGYLGFGMLVLAAAMAVYQIVIAVIGHHKSEHWLCRHAFGLTLGIVLVIYAVLALSPTVTFNDHKLFEVPYPQWILRIWSIFRATGRFVWCIDLLIITWTLMNAARIRIRSAALAAMGIAAVIQIYDLSPFMYKRHVWFAQADSTELVLDDEHWEVWGEAYDHIQMVPFQLAQADATCMFTLADFAKDHDMTLNFYVSARIDYDRVEEVQRLNLEELAAGGADDTLYVFMDEERALASGLELYYVDDLIIGITGR